jgi:TatD DNase family protein
MKLIDTHCHFDLPLFDADREALCAAAKASGLRHIIIPAIDASAWSRMKLLQHAESCQGVSLHMAYGLHPMFIDRHTDKDIDNLKTWLEHEKTVAVGECGLDFFVKGLDRQRQFEIFEAQVMLASDYQLPLIIHARKSLDFILKTIRQYANRSMPLTGVIHSFSGSEQQAKQLIDLGFYLGFGGVITYPRAKKLRHILQTMPLEHLLLETDAPDQPDAEWQGKRNEPARLERIARHIAEIRQDDVENIARITSQNAKQLFKLTD